MNHNIISLLFAGLALLMVTFSQSAAADWRRDNGYARGNYDGRHYGYGRSRGDGRARGRSDWRLQMDAEVNADLGYWMDMDNWLDADEWFDWRNNNGHRHNWRNYRGAPYYYSPRAYPQKHRPWRR